MTMMSEITIQSVTPNSKPRVSPRYHSMETKLMSIR